MRTISQKDKRYIRNLFISLQQPLLNDNRWLYFMGQLDYMLYHKYGLHGLVEVRVFLKNSFPDHQYHQGYEPLKIKWRKLVKEEPEKEKDQCIPQIR